MLQICRGGRPLFEEATRAARRSSGAMMVEYSILARVLYARHLPLRFDRVLHSFGHCCAGSDTVS